MNNVYEHLLNKKVSLKENTLWYTMGDAGILRRRRFGAAQ